MHEFRFNNPQQPIRRPGGSHEGTRLADVEKCKVEKQKPPTSQNPSDPRRK